MFFYMYLLTLILEMLLLTGIIPISSPVYPVSKSCNECYKWLIVYISGSLLSNLVLSHHHGGVLC